MQQINVFSALNLNATTVVVPLGSDNIIAQAPIFRTGRPTTFPPGPNEGIFPVVYNPLNTPEIDWFLQGNMTCNGDTCTGPGAPADTTAPSITGTPVSGGTVTLNPGAWAGSSQVRLLRWIMACDDDGCSAADGATGASSITGPTSFTVPAGPDGKRLRLSIVAYSTRGITMASSALTAPVDGSADTSSPTNARNTGSDFPIQVVGDLALVPDSQRFWNGVPAPAVSHQWQRCSPACTEIPGDTGLAHRVVEADVGSSLRVVTTPDNGAGSATWTSQLAGATATTYTPTGDDPGMRLRAVVTATNSLAPVSGMLPASLPAATELSAPVTPGPINSGPPVISGSGDVGSTLQLDSIGSRTPAPGSTTVAWERCSPGCTPIGGASGPSYVPTSTRACRDAQVEVWTRRRSRPRIRPACPRARRTASRTPFTYGVAVPPAS
jgi:hypothetical protein